MTPPKSIHRLKGTPTCNC